MPPRKIYISPQNVIFLVDLGIVSDLELIPDGDLLTIKWSTDSYLCSFNVLVNDLLIATTNQHQYTLETGEWSACLVKEIAVVSVSNSGKTGIKETAIFEKGAYILFHHSS